MFPAKAGIAKEPAVYTFLNKIPSVPMRSPPSRGTRLLVLSKGVPRGDSVFHLFIMKSFIFYREGIGAAEGGGVPTPHDLLALGPITTSSTPPF